MGFDCLASRVDGRVSGGVCSGGKSFFAMLYNMDMFFVIVGCVFRIICAGVGYIRDVLVSFRQAVSILIIVVLFPHEFIRKDSAGNNYHVVMDHRHGGL